MHFVLMLTVFADFTRNFLCVRVRSGIAHSRTKVKNKVDMTLAEHMQAMLDQASSKNPKMVFN